MAGQTTIQAWPHVPSLRATVPSGLDPGNPNGWKQNLDLIQTVVNKKQDAPASPTDGALQRYNSTSGLWEVIAPGTDGQVLQIASGAPTWANPNQGSVTWQDGKTYTITGAVNVASGESDFILPFFVPVHSGQIVKLIGLRYLIHAGTSATVKAVRNGSDIAGLTSLTVGTAAGSANLSSPLTLADGDLLALVVTAVSGTPQNMTVTYVIEHTI